MVATLAETLGTPLLPWQKYVADVAGERRADGSYEHQVIVVTVPRQCGKTTLLRSVGTLRALLGRDVFYTAQTGKDARARWADLVKLIRQSPALREPRSKIALRGGSEHIAFPSGGVFQVFAPTPESLHGYTPPTVFIDEAFAQSADAGELLMGAIGPAQFTITDKQLWIVSTAGTAASTFLHDWIDRAIEGNPRTAGFYWGASDEHDPFDLDDIAAFHPAVGFELNGRTMTAADVLAEADRNSRAEYERAFANRRTLTVSHLISADDWRILLEDKEPAALPADLTRTTITYDVALHRAAGAIHATWENDDGTLATCQVAAAPGVSWMVDALDKLITDHRPRAVVAADNGPVLEVTAQLRLRGHDITTLGEREYATASGAFLTMLDDRAFIHDGTEHVERSVTGLVPRPGAVDGVAFSRRHSVGDSSPGIATALGLWVASQAEHGRPVFQFAS